MTDEEIAERLALIRARAERLRDDREGDRLIAKTLKIAARGMIAIMVFWIAWLVVTGMVATRENRRIDELTRRVEQLERAQPAEHP